MMYLINLITQILPRKTKDKLFQYTYKSMQPRQEHYNFRDLNNILPQMAPGDAFQVQTKANENETRNWILEQTTKQVC